MRPISARPAVVVALPEQIDLSNAAGVAEELTAAVSRNAAVIIDMSATTFCDCAGSRAIVRAYKWATDSGTELRIVATTELVRRIFGLKGVDRLLDIYPSVAAAHARDGTDSRAESAGPDPVTRSAAKAQVNKAILPARPLLKPGTVTLNAVCGRKTTAPVKLPGEPTREDDLDRDLPSVSTRRLSEGWPGIGAATTMDLPVTRLIRQSTLVSRPWTDSPTAALTRGRAGHRTATNDLVSNRSSSLLHNARGPATGPAGRPANVPDVQIVRQQLRALGRADRITSVQRLSGGVIADVWLITYADGTHIVAKTVTGAPADLFAVEAEGLAVLRATGHLQTPRVLAVTGQLLLLEALPDRDDSQPAWERFARDLAAAHRGTVHDRFGWHRDGYLGRLGQVNTWTGSGHEFFAEHRLLRYLREPAAWQALDPGDRRALERLCDRLPQLLPALPAVLTHGDLWAANLLSRRGRIAVIDPAICYMWAETDLSMLWSCPRPPASARFFGLYQELNPSPPGWIGRMPILHLRELLSTVAHFGTEAASTIQRIRHVLAPFR